MNRNLCVEKARVFRPCKISVLQLLGVLIDFLFSTNPKVFYKFLIPSHVSIPVSTKPISKSKYLVNGIFSAKFLIRISIKCTRGTERFFLRCAKCEASKTKSTTAVISLWQPHALHSYWSLPRSRRGDCYILTVQCSLTKWAEAFAIFNQRAITCSKVPDSIHGNHDRNFESKIFLEICQQLSVNKTRTSTYQPECDGQVENLHKTLKGMLIAKVSGSPVTWDEHLNVCMMAYHSSDSSYTEHTPFVLVLGKEMTIPLDVMVGKDKDNTINVPTLTSLLMFKRIFKKNIEMLGRTFRLLSDARRIPMTRE